MRPATALHAAPLRCLVVDDEPLGRRAVCAHVETHPLLSVAGEARDGFEAAAALRSGGVDAVFLDLEMPKLGGFDMLRSLARPPLVVVVTAYPERALEGFEEGVVDYLVKPVSAARFAMAAGRLLDAASGAAGAPGTAPGSEATLGTVFVPSDGLSIRVDLAGLRVAEAWGNYVRLHLDGEAVLTKGALRTLEAELPPEAFLRVHRSYVVGLHHVERVGPASVRVGGREVPVSRARRASLLARLGLA